MSQPPDQRPGPDPSSLETHDPTPPGVSPISLRVTYTDFRLTDYVNMKRTDGQLCIELGPPLFGVVSRAGKLNDLKNELKEAIAFIGIGDLLEHFTDTVQNYAHEILPSFDVPELNGLGLAVYILKKLWEKNKLILGYIHHASIDEMGAWIDLIAEAEALPGAAVKSE